jgi:hypothetical protein
MNGAVSIHHRKHEFLAVRYWSSVKSNGIPEIPAIVRAIVRGCVETGGFCFYVLVRKLK